MPRSKPPSCRPALVEREQRLQVCLADRLPERATSQRRDDLPRTARLLRPCEERRLRTTGEDPPPRRRVSRSRGVERAGDRQHPDMRAARPVERVERALEKRTELRGVHGGGAADERGDDVVRSGADTDANGQAAHRSRRPFPSVVSNAAARSAAPPIVAWWTRSPSTVSSNSCGYSMPRGLSKLVRNNLVWRTYSPSRGKKWVTRVPPERAERHPVEVLILRDVAAHVIGLAERARLRVADRQLADLLRRGQIALLQRQATRSAHRRCCRSRRPNHRAAAARRHRRPSPGDRGRRWRTPRDSAGEAAAAPDWDAPPTRDRARFRSTSRTRLWCAHQVVAHRPVASTRRAACARPFPRSRPSRRRRRS